MELCRRLERGKSGLLPLVARLPLNVNPKSDCEETVLEGNLGLLRDNEFFVALLGSLGGGISLVDCTAWPSSKYCEVCEALEELRRQPKLSFRLREEPVFEASVSVKACVLSLGSLGSFEAFDILLGRRMRLLEDLLACCVVSLAPSRFFFAAS